MGIFVKTHTLAMAMAIATSVPTHGASLNILYPNFNYACAEAAFDRMTRENKHPRYRGSTEGLWCEGEVDDAVLLISDRTASLSTILRSLEPYYYAYRTKQECSSLHAFTHYIVYDLSKLEKDIMDSQIMFFNVSISASDQAILCRVNDDNLKVLLSMLHNFVFDTWDAARCMYGVGVRFD